MAIAASRGRHDPSARPKAWSVGLLFAYVAFVALMQALVSPTVEQDQAEQLVLAQHPAWNYTHQPPLYTWLVWALAQLSSHLVAILWTLKVGLSCLLVVACDGTARELGLTSAQRRVAVAGLALMPAVIWEAQRDLTHSLLATALLACVLWSVVASLNRPAWWRDVLTGCLAGGAMLSKHNALVLLLALPAALWMVPDMRARVRVRGIMLAAAVALAVWAPHGLWLWQHPGSLGRTFEKLHRMPASGAYAWWTIWWEAGLALAAFLLPWGMLALPMAWRARRPRPAGRFLACLAGCSLACLVVFTVALDVTRFNPRWLLPVLFFWPMWLAASTDPARERWGRRMVSLGLAGALLVAAVMPARVVWGGQPTRQNLPYAALAEGLQQQWRGVPPVLLVGNHLDGGNLKGCFGDRVEILTPIVPWTVPLPDTVVLVFRETDLRDPRLAPWLYRVTGRRVSDLVWQGDVSAPFLYRPASDPVHLKWAVVVPRVPR